MPSPVLLEQDFWCKLRLFKALPMGTAEAFPALLHHPGAASGSIWDPDLGFGMPAQVQHLTAGHGNLHRHKHCLVLDVDSLHEGLPT